MICKVSLLIFSLEMVILHRASFGLFLSFFENIINSACAFSRFSDLVFS